MTNKKRPPKSENNLPEAVTPPKEKGPESGPEKISLPDKAPALPFFVAGLGASAGGLEALEVFFQAMPESSGVAYVVITHLEPSHASMMAELIQKRTRMPVVPAQDAMPLEPDHVYVKPPEKDLFLKDGRIHLVQTAAPGFIREPINTFLRSLADDQQDRAIGIILSGMGSDGKEGVRAIKGGLGMVMAQDPHSAKYDSMPRIIIENNLADYILPPEKMAEQLLAYVQASVTQPELLPTTAEKAVDSLLKVFVLLRGRTGHDFSGYKRNTILRRIQRRMHVHQLNKMPDYLRYMQQNPQETQLLFKELLIGVTNFFRDPEAFATLKSKVLPELVKDKPENYTFRIWMPGCSTGEETYSLAILLREYLARATRIGRCRSSGPTSTPTPSRSPARGSIPAPSPAMSPPSGSSGISTPTTRASRSSRPSAKCWSSPPRTSSRTRLLPSWTCSAAATS